MGASAHSSLLLWLGEAGLGRPGSCPVYGCSMPLGQPPPLTMPTGQGAGTPKPPHSLDSLLSTFHIGGQKGSEQRP